MSIINTLNSIFQGKDYSDRIRLCFDFSEKFAHFNLCQKIIKSDSKKIIINFDVNFFKYLKSNNSELVITNLFTDIFNSIKKLVFENKFYIIIGLDLLDVNNIKSLLKQISAVSKVIIFTSLEKTFLNLTDNVEYKRDLIIKNVDDYIYEKSCKNKETKTNELYQYYLMERNCFKKNSIEYVVLEYKVNTQKLLPIEKLEFLNINLYKKEHRDLFELVEDDIKTNIEPISTFNLQIKKDEEEARNKVILPYLKENNDKINEDLIKVNQEDLNELYMMDPDEDLDI